MIFHDQLNRVVSLSKTPTRIVSLVPSQTELIVDLGLRDKIVGITKFCVHPADLRKEKTVVGGTKEVNYQKIIDLKPDIILCNKEENTQQMVSALDNIAPVWVSDVINISDCLEMIQAFGKMFDSSAKAEYIIEDINTEMKKFLAIMEDRDIKKVAYLIWKNPYMCAGKNTFINTLLQLNKLVNIVPGAAGRYPTVDLAILREAEVILLSSEPFPFKEKDVLSLRHKLGVDVKLVNGEYFSWYGSRLKDAFKYFRSLD